MLTERLHTQDKEILSKLHLDSFPTTLRLLEHLNEFQIRVAEPKRVFKVLPHRVQKSGTFFSDLYHSLKLSEPGRKKVAIIGPPGSGKSTLSYSIEQLVELSQGQRVHLKYGFYHWWYMMTNFGEILQMNKEHARNIALMMVEGVKQFDSRVTADYPFPVLLIFETGGGIRGKETLEYLATNSGDDEIIALNIISDERVQRRATEIRNYINALEDIDDCHRILNKFHIQAGPNLQSILQARDLKLLKDSFALMAQEDDIKKINAEWYKDALEWAGCASLEELTKKFEFPGKYQQIVKRERWNPYSIENMVGKIRLLVLYRYHQALEMGFKPHQIKFMINTLMENEEIYYDVYPNE